MPQQMRSQILQGQQKSKGPLQTLMGLASPFLSAMGPEGALGAGLGNALVGNGAQGLGAAITQFGSSKPGGTPGINPNGGELFHPIETNSNIVSHEAGHELTGSQYITPPADGYGKSTDMDPEEEAAFQQWYSNRSNQQFFGGDIEKARQFYKSARAADGAGGLDNMHGYM